MEQMGLCVRLCTFVSPYLCTSLYVLAVSAVILPAPGVIRERHTLLASAPARVTRGRELDIATPH